MEKPKGRIQFFDSAFKLAGGLVTAVTVAVVGIVGTHALERRQAYDTNVRLYADLMSKREEAETSLRKDMFESIIGSFLTPKDTGFEQQVLNLELLAFNFHEALDLAPLFKHVYAQIGASGKPDAREYLGRLERAALEVKRKQITALEEAGDKLDATIDLDELRKTPAGITVIDGEVPTLRTVNDFGYTEMNKTTFKVTALMADPQRKEIRVQLEVRTPKKSDKQSNAKEANYVHSVFMVSHFDFPMIDNTRLPYGQRCAIVLKSFKESVAEVTLVYFPGSRASLKEKPFYDEVRHELLALPVALEPPGRP